MAEDNSDYVPLLVNGEERPAEVQWFVVPYDGWWSLWKGEVEMTWPNGDRKVLWRGHSRDRERLIERTQRRFLAWVEPSHSPSSVPPERGT